MQTPTTSQSTPLLIRLGVYTQGRLTADTRTRELAPLCKQRTDDIRAARRARESAQEGLIVTEAFADAADDGLDLTTRAFADAVYNAAGRDRGAMAWKRVFPGGVTPFTQPRLADQVEAAKGLLRHLGTLGTDPVVAEHKPRIEAGLADLTAALAPVKKAAADLEAARTAEYLARSAFVATYVSTYGAVIEKLGARRLAEPFFRRFRAEPDADEPETPPPA